MCVAFVVLHACFRILCAHLWHIAGTGRTNVAIYKFETIIFIILPFGLTLFSLFVHLVFILSFSLSRERGKYIRKTSHWQAATTSTPVTVHTKELVGKEGSASVCEPLPTGCF